MYPLAIIRYRRPLEEVLPHLKEHRAYRQGLYHNGWLRASGLFQPRSGGALPLRVPGGDLEATLDRIRDQDPLVQHGVAQYQLLPLTPAIRAGGLERIGVNP